MNRCASRYGIWRTGVWRERREPPVCKTSSREYQKTNRAETAGTSEEATLSAESAGYVESDLRQILEDLGLVETFRVE